MKSLKKIVLSGFAFGLAITASLAFNVSNLFSVQIWREIPGTNIMEQLNSAGNDLCTLVDRDAGLCTVVAPSEGSVYYTDEFKSQAIPGNQVFAKP